MIERPRHNTENLPSEEQLLEVSRDIVTRALAGTANISWEYVFRHVEPCQYALTQIQRGVPPERISDMFTGGKKTGNDFGSLVLVAGGIKSGKFEQFIKQKLEEARAWADRTSLDKIDKADTTAVLEVLKARVERCTIGQKQAVRWSTFFTEPENRQLVKDVIQTHKETEPDVSYKEILQKVSLLLTNERSPTALLNFTNSLPRTSGKDALERLMTFLSQSPS